LESQFLRLWNHVGDLQIARTIFKRLGSKESLDLQIIEKHEKSKSIQFDISSIQRFIQLQPPLGDGVVEKLRQLLEDEKNAEECGKFLMEKAINIFLEKINQMNDDN